MLINMNELQQGHDMKWMQYALKLAQKAECSGEVPVGAVILQNDQIIGEGWNQPIAASDPTAHAEMIALRQAGQNQNNYRLLNTTLYVTLEPCVMCLGAMVHARIQRVVFGAKDPKAGSLCSAFCLLEHGVFNHEIQWDHLIEMEPDCSHILKTFFLARRKGCQARLDKNISTREML